jgi:hypothetical protein
VRFRHGDQRAPQRLGGSLTENLLCLTAGAQHKGLVVGIRPEAPYKKYRRVNQSCDDVAVADNGTSCDTRLSSNLLDKRTIPAGRDKKANINSTQCTAPASGNAVEIAATGRTGGNTREYEPCWAFRSPRDRAGEGGPRPRSPAPRPRRRHCPQTAQCTAPRIAVYWAPPRRFCSRPRRLFLSTGRGRTARLWDSQSASV